MASGSVSPTVQVTVAARWAAKTVGGYASSGGYRLYHYTAACPSSMNGCPTFLFALAPAHAGTRVSCEVQWYVGGRWRGDRIPFKLDDSSRLKLRHHYSDREVIGVRRRVRVTFGGDGNHIGSTSAWVYWKVTA